MQRNDVRPIAIWVVIIITPLGHERLLQGDAHEPNLSSIDAWDNRPYSFLWSMHYKSWSRGHDFNDRADRREATAEAKQGGGEKKIAFEFESLATPLMTPVRNNTGHRHAFPIRLIAVQARLCVLSSSVQSRGRLSRIPR